jgi:hypothetical protein
VPQELRREFWMGLVHIADDRQNRRPSGGFLDGNKLPTKLPQRFRLII